MHAGPGFTTESPKRAGQRLRQAMRVALDRRLILGTPLGGLHEASTGCIAVGSPPGSSEVQR